jgi:3-isopropylmalate/(R)-2-methylmalate dehydratase small subunit
MMEPVNIISGRVAPLQRANVDTDQIIPKQFLKRVERSGFGEFLFYDWAADHEGEPDPEFVLNNPAYQDAVVLVTGPNFGSGSSREHAPWSLHDWGFEAIVAPSFADIFYTNCTKIGLLPIVLAADDILALTDVALDPTNEITIDLGDQTVSAPGFEATFEIDAFTKDCLMTGVDGIDLTLAHTEKIEGHEEQRPKHRPTVSR